MIRLMRKEWRQLLPIAYLWLAVLLLNYVIQFFTERVDEQTFFGWCEGYCGYESSATVTIFSALIALVTAYSLFPREHDDATIDLLRALPVGRSRIFVAKVLTAWLLLCAINLVAYGLDAFLLGLNPESIGGTFYPQVWATLFWRDCLFAFIVLSHGVFLSWFRTVGLIIYAIYLIALMLMESQFGTSGLWSLFSLHANEYDGSRLLVNQMALAIHTAVAICLLIVAYWLWDRSESSGSGATYSSKGFRILQAFLSIAGFALLLGILAYRVSVGTGTSPIDMKVLATSHYRFVYSDSKSSTVQYIVDHAEDDYSRLARLLGVQELPNIRVDLSAQSEHAAGLASWKKIKMDLNAFSEDLSQRRVLSHETTHVLQAVESDRALSANYSAVKFFIEGMAQYASFEIVPEEQRRATNWELATISWKRQNIDFDDLIDEAEFTRRFDPELHYSLGDLWTRALVDTCSSEALGDFLRAAGRDGAVKNLPAAIFWRDTMREIKCDLDTVNVTWRSQMQSLFEAVDQSHFPEYSDVSISRDPIGQIVVQASLRQYTDTTQSFQMPVRFSIRVASDTGRLAAGVDPVFRGQLLDSPDGKIVRFLIPSSAIVGNQFRYQLGYTPSVESRYYYESWKRGSV